MKSNLYINEVWIDKEIPRDNYLRKLPVVRNLRRMGGNRFSGNGLYILDEPEAALSPMRLMRLMVCMQGLVKQDSQFIISTHSPILMTFPDAEVMEITDDGIRSVDYKDTEHYIVTKRFMDAPEKIVESLLGEG